MSKMRDINEKTSHGRWEKSVIFMKSIIQEGEEIMFEVLKPVYDKHCQRKARHAEMNGFERDCNKTLILICKEIEPFASASISCHI